jgi:hypothetical protein
MSVHFSTSFKKKLWQEIILQLVLSTKRKKSYIRINYYLFWLNDMVLKLNVSIYHIID